jgi:hypothetical protein
MTNDRSPQHLFSGQTSLVSSYPTGTPIEGREWSTGSSVWSDIHVLASGAVDGIASTFVEGASQTSAQWSSLALKLSEHLELYGALSRVVVPNLELGSWPLRGIGERSYELWRILSGESTPGFGRASLASAQLAARSTGGGIRNEDLQVRFEDED